MRVKTILVVDDSKNVRDLLRDYLSGQGYQVLTATDGEDALFILERETVDLILLDVMMPMMDGFSFIKRYRKESGVPIIMVTAKRTEEDMVRGFELGADDYIVKPFQMRVLLMRVRAVLKRTGSQESDDEVLEVGAIVMDKIKRTVSVDQEAVSLTPIEFCVLEQLMDSAEHTLTRQALSLALMENSFTGSESTLKIHIRNLRQKIERDPTDPRFIETVFGVGYRLKEVV